MEESSEEIEADGRCISCPDHAFLDCPTNVSTARQLLGLPPRVQQGYAEFALNYSAMNVSRQPLCSSASWCAITGDWPPPLIGLQ